MNYQDIAGMAPYQPWAAKYKADLDAQNILILAERQKGLDARTGIGVGDFVLDGDKVLRVAHHWGDGVQLTDGRYGASFYLSTDGHVSFSGGLAPPIPLERFEASEERRKGSCWFFSQNNAMGHNGWPTEAEFRVFRLTA